MRYVLILLFALLMPVTAARADVSISIGINVPVYPTLVRVPGYPAYYDPRIDANYFFYDGLYWVYWDDHWYASSWYNGPWQFVDPYYVPVFVLCIPVRYYRHRPHYFSHWHDDEPPHWGEHWGHDWERRRSGWNRWDRHSAPEPAPLPSYQRDYSGDRYPREVGRQQRIRADNYRFEPHERVSRQHFQRETQRAQSGSDTRVDRQPRPAREPQLAREPRVEREPQRQRESRIEREPRPQSQPQQSSAQRERRPSPQPIERGGRDTDSRPDMSRERVREAAPPRQERERSERARPDADGPRQRTQQDRDPGERSTQGGKDRDEREQGRGRDPR